MTGLHDELRDRVGLEKLAHDADRADLERRAREAEQHEDAPGGLDDRYALYGLFGGERRRLAETSLSGLGLCLRTLLEEGEFNSDTRIGILDRETRTWLVNPWARG